MSTIKRSDIWPEQKYSYSRPPVDRNEGIRRLDELEEIIAIIVADLKSKTKDDVGNPEVYAEWKTRAQRSLQHRRRERAFLLKWTGVEKINISAGKKLGDHVTEFLTKISPYKPLARNDPRFDTQIGREFYREGLVARKSAYTDFIVQLPDTARQFGCGEIETEAARKRVSTVLRMMEGELSHIKFKASEAWAKGHPEQNHLQASSDPRLGKIFNRLNVCKKALGMENTEVISWLYGRLIHHKTKITFTPEEERILLLVQEYVELTQERKSFERPSK